MKAIIQACFRCIHHIACHKHGLMPALGECSTVKENDRGAVLLSMLGNMRPDMTGYTRKPVPVIRDFLGTEQPFTVHRVSLLSGNKKNPNTLVFCLGKDEFGEMVTTDEISTRDLQKIDEQIKPLHDLS